MAILVVAIMVASAFVMLASVAKAPASTPADDTPARTLAGEREVSFTISNIGESYLKDSRDVDGARGLHSATPGLSEWWWSRLINYSDTVAHDSYPYYVAYQPESSNNNYNKVAHLPYGTYGFYRLAIEARNLTTVATGPGKDPLYIPILGGGSYAAGLAMDGGTVKLKWHFTYLTTNDKDKMVAGTHYANTYYGVVASVLAPFDSQQYPNDGWYVEQTGTAEFDRLAAAKFLGLENPSTSLIDQFNTKNTPTVPGAQGPMNQSWWENYLADGRNAGPAGNPPAGAYNIFACYDYDINSGPSRNYFLKVDPGLSTPDKLVLRIWGCVWGTEYLMLRYLDVQGLQPNFIASPEDWYFNATITTTGANIESRMSAVYHMTTWKDTNWWGPAYMLEAQHVDYNDLGDGWTSRFFDYMAYATNWRPTRAQYEPGTNNFGVETAYITTPTLWNLADREKLVVKLPTGPHMGYIPYTGTVDDAFPKFGGGNLAKIAEMNTHQMWGELVLGPGTLPSGLYTVSNYSAATKTLTINGPTNFAGNMNPHTGYTTLYETGVPKLMFDVAKVSDYVMTLPAGPYQTGVTYTMTVTAKNISGNTVTDWNGTVNMVASAGVTLGAAQHVYSIGEAGVWTTTVLFTTTGSKTITATDSLFSLDVKTTLSVTPGGFDLVLAKGWNLVTVPLVGYGYKASTLGLLNGDVVSGWNSSTLAYDKNYIVGSSPARNDFLIAESTGYWIYANAVETLSLLGSVPTTPQTRTITVPAVTGGWVIVGFNSLNTTRHASNIPAMYSGGVINTVAGYNTTSGLYNVYTGIPRTDFWLVPGQAYWCWCTASGVLTYNP
jgi:hypothetical protein